MSTTLPATQYAVQLVGPGQLVLNRQKPVHAPTGHQILAKIECVGLCFSDLKLLKQFNQHARKSEVARGLSADILRSIPSYVPGDAPTVPGHEVTARIVAIGDKVKHHRVGERCLIQTDYRDLPTHGSNSAFGYNFEGALQEYVIMDERVVVGGDGERYLIPVNETLSASAIALVEPWACVEDSYVDPERQHLLVGGRLLVVVAPGASLKGVPQLVARHRPAAITVVGEHPDFAQLTPRPQVAADVASLPAEGFDDIIYAGTDAETIGVLNDKLAVRGLINIVLGGGKIGKLVSVGVGRVHYGRIRWIGTPGSDCQEPYTRIPASGELRPNDRVVVIGAGGPMGQMHVIRDLCAGVPGISVTGTDMDDARLESLRVKAEPVAKAFKTSLRLVNTKKTPLNEKFTYFGLMAPVGALVAAAVGDSSQGAMINIFAGIPVNVRQDMDLDAYIAKACYMFGTSGSLIRDMKILIGKLEAGTLDTNVSVDAICGMAGVADGIAAVENRTLAGKIIVYPILKDVGLIPLTDLAKRFPTVAAKLVNGNWSKAAEDELVRLA